MVTFTCQNCNSCLKKKAVENHLYKCKNPVLTCIDCVKDFDCKNYSGHVTCITENERYGGQGFVPSSAMQKQTEWFKCITEINSRKNLSPPTLKKIINFAADYPTCPRNKKKFINFILNNKAFLQFRALAESAFDLINDEFSKKNSDNSESSNDTSNNGKRKKISETDLQDETENLTIETTNEKNSKKKNKKLNVFSSQNDVELDQNNDNKNNKTNSESKEENGETNETHGKKKKKNKHLKNSKNGSLNEDEGKQNGEEVENGIHNEDEVEDVNILKQSNGISTNGVNELNGVDLSKLSKKERKKLLKQKKYEAEVNSIENYKKEDEQIVDSEEDKCVEGEKKNKKKKQKSVNGESGEIDRKQKRSISEPDDKKIRLEEEEEIAEVIEKPKKFKWDEVIIQVLQTQDDGEMSLKRLSKKICAEYANVYGERESYEEVLNKFNKKIIRTPGVRVLKDKAKLLSTD